MTGPGGRILLTGATGFVGRALWPALEAAGYNVRGLTRNLDRARALRPEADWACGDAADDSALREAMQGCRAAFYLVHGMGRGAGNFRERDLAAARGFARAAAEAGLERLVYLGGVQPQGPPSEHLASRLEVGRTLLEGPVPALELRASMIVGHGSLSWLIVRDLAARLPAMVAPSWLSRSTEPVDISDVVAALTAGLSLPMSGPASYDLPGPETLTEKEILARTATALGLQRPVMVSVPVLSPWLSSHWIRVVTRAEWSVASEVVLGLEYDLVARDDAYWRLIGHTDRVNFNEAARRAVALEGPTPVGGFAGFVESLLRRFRGRPDVSQAPR